MTEFAYHYHENPLGLVSNAAETASEFYDAVLFDVSGVRPSKMVVVFEDISNSMNNDENLQSVMILFYEDVLSCMTHIFKQANSKIGMCGFKSRFNFSLNTGTRIPVVGKDGLKSSITRVALVLTRGADYKMNESKTAGKDLYIEEGKSSTSFKGSAFQKCIGGESISTILYKFNYEDWSSVLVANFGRPLVADFSKYQPSSPTERFPFTLHVADSNIRTISSERMEIAIDEISCNFDECPTAQETTSIMKEIEAEEKAKKEEAAKEGL